mmetsp:Transcript_18/g.73  ORF Transcript_18/g.73 Transcript_18/m.73 type:complete len:82 (+) Transcript_18:705-950(+)
MTGLESVVVQIARRNRNGKNNARWASVTSSSSRRQNQNYPPIAYEGAERLITVLFVFVMHSIEFLTPWDPIPLSLNPWNGK